jgi:uncharacterized low-complexity protein
MSNSIVKPVSLVVGAALLGSLTCSVAAAPGSLAAVDLDHGYMLVGDQKGEEGKCGEGKCGSDKGEEGKCGEGKCGSDKGEEGKCGEGKCGSDKGEEGKCGEGKCGGDKGEEGKCGGAA